MKSFFRHLSFLPFKQTKYHQATFVYLINAGLFLAIFKKKVHFFGIWNSLLFTIGIVMMGTFAFLIYRGYRWFTMALAGVYVIRTLVVLARIPFFTNKIIFMLLLQGLTCFMLVRAAFDIEIFRRN